MDDVKSDTANGNPHERTKDIAAEFEVARRQGIICIKRGPEVGYFVEFFGDCISFVDLSESCPYSDREGGRCFVDCPLLKN